MISEAIEKTGTRIGSESGFQWNKIPNGGIRTFISSHKQDLVIDSIRSSRLKFNFSFNDAVFIVEPNTRTSIFTICPEINTKITIDEPNSSKDLKISDNLNSIAIRFLFKIEELDRQNKKLQSIKESHRLFEKLLRDSSFEIVDHILKLTITRKFSLAVLIAFLASTLPYKYELPCRNLLFDKAKKIAVAESGEEIIRKSIFNNLM